MKMNSTFMFQEPVDFVNCNLAGDADSMAKLTEKKRKKFEKKKNMLLKAIFSPKKLYIGRRTASTSMRESFKIKI
jgi:hypothetical protein